MQTINEDIRTGQFHRSYLLYGDEAYLKLQYRDRLVKALVNEGDTMNITRYEGTGTDVGELIDLAETLPFFADKRVIIVSGSGFFKSSNDALAEYLGSSAKTTVLIFVEDAVDKRSKTYKAIQRAGYVCDFSQPDERALMRWIGDKLKKEGKTMARDAWPEFYQRTSESMENMDHEFEKLLMYCWDRGRITREDVEAVCTRQLTSQVFDMIDAIAAKDVHRVLGYYRDMLSMKEPPLRILALIERQFIQMLAIRQMTQDHVSDQVMAQRLGVRSFVIPRSRKLSRQFPADQMQKLLEDASDTEECIKTGRLNEQMGVELLMIRYAGKEEDA